MLTVMAAASSWASGCASESDALPTTSTTEGPSTPPAPAVDLRFAPVLLSIPTPCGDVAITSEVAVDPAALSPGDDGCFQLDTAADLDGRDVVDACAELVTGTWAVALEFFARGIDKFNDVAEACFVRAPSCPTGQLAIVVDGIVVSAPTIELPSFERDQIQISGDFDEAEAKDLALARRPPNPEEHRHADQP